jgi:hydroxymethylpyrimidine pyrophosphatase-like HAD family hydrolase
VNTFLFTDLDDTLFQTLAKCPPGQELAAAAFLADGRANSFSTPRQRALLELLAAQASLIPTTARDLASYQRVSLPISFTSYSIVNFGGLVLKPDGSLDTDWYALMQADMARAKAGLQDITARLDAYCIQNGLPNRARVITDAGIEFFALLKDPEKNLSRLNAIEKAVIQPWLSHDGGDFVLHTNGNNHAILPKSLDKSRAVAYVSDLLRAEHGEILTLGMGDSRSDGPFLALCDYAISPRNSQLARSCFSQFDWVQP